MPVLFLSTILLNSHTVNAEKKIFFTRKTCKFQSKPLLSYFSLKSSHSTTETKMAIACLVCQFGYFLLMVVEKSLEHEVYIKYGHINYEAF